MKNRVIRLFSLLLLPALLGGEMRLPAVNAADTETGEVAAELTDDSAEDVTAEEAATDYSVYGNYEQIVWIEGMDGVVPYPDSESNIHKLSAAEAAELTKAYEGELVFSEGEYLAYVPDGKSDTTITVIPENYDSRLKYKVTAYNHLVDQDCTDKLKANKDGSYSLKVIGLEAISFKAVADGEKDPVPEHIPGGYGPLDPQPEISNETTELTLVKGQKFMLGQKDWISDSKKTVAISKGKVSAKAAGSATIKRDGQTIKVTVKEIAFSEKKKELYIGKGQNVGLLGAEGMDVYYDSSNKDVVGVDGNGNLYPFSKGTATVSAYVNGVQIKCNVKVNDFDKSKKDFSQTVELEPLQSVNIKIPGFKPQKAVWSSETQIAAENLPKGCVFQDSVVRISKSGKLTAIGAGETVLTAKGGSEADVTIRIRVNDVWLKEIHLCVGQTKKINISGLKGKAVLTPEFENRIKIDGNKIKGVEAGMLTLEAKYEGFTSYITVYVDDPAIKKLAKQGSGYNYTLNMKKGEIIDISPEACHSALVYKCNKSEVAAVYEDGSLIARGVGKAKITTKVNGKTVTVKLNVTE